jgi:alkylated DNA nucleotide flippase Atl1
MTVPVPWKRVVMMQGAMGEEGRRARRRRKNTGAQSFASLRFSSVFL